MKKMKIQNNIISFLIIALLMFAACEKLEPEIPVGSSNKLIVTTTALNNVSYHEATSGGSIEIGDLVTVVNFGVVWGTEENPDIENNSGKTVHAYNLNSFISTLTELDDNTTYYVRAYATCTERTIYGEQLSFKTKALGIPLLTTTEVSSITSNSCISGGNITDDVGNLVTARGVVWSTSENPELPAEMKILNKNGEAEKINDKKQIANKEKSVYKNILNETKTDIKFASKNKDAKNETGYTVDGTGKGEFVSNIENLNQGTTYYVRAYATNSVGTNYGNQISFTTLGPPSITTTQASDITTNSAQTGGNVSSDGGSPVTARGVCWSTSEDPQITDSLTTNGTGTGSFTSNITGLTPGTIYFARAYATNEHGTKYGNQISFTTKTTPTVTANDASNITSTTAISGGNVTSDGGLNVTARGVCWNTTGDPQITDSHTTDDSGTGSFTSNITELNPGITYFVRAYATNSAGTSYSSNQISFITGTTPTVTITNQSSVTTTTAISGGNVTSDGGLNVTARGVCWNTTGDPHITDSHTTDDSGTGSFTSNITELNPGITYFVRAYATNSAGTSYSSNQISFETVKHCGESFTDNRDGNVYQTIQIGEQCWMAENLKYLPSVIGPSAGSQTTAYYYVYGYSGTSVSTAKATDNYNTYGVLYNWTAVMSTETSSSANPSGVQGVCPEGWHLPSDQEWNTLTSYIGGTSVAGGKLKATSYWNSPNSGATNEYGFTALPGGYRYNNGIFDLIGNNGYWWTATENAASSAWTRYLHHNFSNVTRGGLNKEKGLSVRCVRNY